MLQYFTKQKYIPMVQEVGFTSYENLNACTNSFCFWMLSTAWNSYKFYVWLQKWSSFDLCLGIKNETKYYGSSNKKEHNGIFLFLFFLLNWVFPRLSRKNGQLPFASTYQVTHFSTPTTRCLRILCNFIIWLSFLL